MTLIFYLSDQPKLPHPLRKRGVSDYVFDYAAHAITFGALTGMIWRAATSLRTRWCGPLSANRLALAMALSLAYAASDELHQGFVPGRTASPRDLLADAGGIALAGLVLWGWLAWRDRLLGSLWHILRNTWLGRYLGTKISADACAWMSVDA